MRRMLPASLIAPLLFACTQEKASRDEPIITVENGVTIVTNPGLHLADTLAWRIDTTTAVKIGVFEGEDEYMFGRVSGVLLRPNGWVLVADAAASELRLFDVSGTFIRRIGRKGIGPGEFTMFSELMPHRGDSVLVLDHEGRRVNVFGPDLGFVRSFRIRLLETRLVYPATSDNLEDVFADGSLLMSDFLNVCGDRRTNGFCEDSVALFRTDQAGATLARFGRHVYIRQQSARVRPGALTSWREPYAQSFWRAGGDRFYYADAKRFEYHVFRMDGKLERIVRVVADPPQYTRDDVFYEWKLPANADPRRVESARAYNQAIATASVPDTLPHFSDMLVDATDHVWLREYQPPQGGHKGPAWWYVFDPEGRLRYAVRSPRGLIRSPAPYVRDKPYIGEDRIVGAASDEDGVEQVITYRLMKASGS